MATPIDWCWKKECCDPFKCHSVSKFKGLRDVSEQTRDLYPSLKFQLGDRICTQCRKKVMEQPVDNPHNAATESSQSEDEHIAGISGEAAIDTVNDPDDTVYVSSDHNLAVLNMSLHGLGESPVVKRQADTRVNYVKKKIKSIHTTVKRQLELIAGPLSDEDDVMQRDGGSDAEIIQQLKEKFNSCTLKNEKVQILTVLPKSWSAIRVQQEFAASNYMVRKAKRLVQDHGILSLPTQKAGRTLSARVVDDVREFYCSDTMSRIMPGMKDFVSVNIEGQRQHIQKRLILCNLREIFEQFKHAHPQHKIGFSKFAELRPKECVLAGSSGTHAVCVCTIHQNVKLMFHGAKLEGLSDGYSYKNCLAEIKCNPPRVQCFLDRCEECPGIEILQHKLEQHFDEHGLDHVEFRQWTTTDRATLETKIQSVEEFLTSFLDSISTLQRHDFIAKQQSQFLQTTKSGLKVGEFLVVGDFAENYSFVLQDAAQSFHWNNLQATIHPFICYYTDATNESTKHVSFVVVSESNTHDTVAVHLFQRVLIAFLTSKIARPTKIVYFSDGCASQYKNRKNFANLCFHEQDFGMPAEWHFFATSHGKGPCDGVGGTVKRLAARASLQRPYENQILTPRQLFEFGCASIPAVNFHFTSIEDHERESTFLQKRFESTRTIAGTHRLHSFRPISADKLEVREFSANEEKRIECVFVNSSPTPDNVVNVTANTGYITAVYDHVWWLAYITKTMPDSGEVEVSFLVPRGPSRSFHYPTRADILVISSEDVLTVVNPITATGRSYVLSQVEIAAAGAALTRKTAQ
jgi:hypothetical protein